MSRSRPYSASPTEALSRTSPPSNAQSFQVEEPSTELSLSFLSKFLSFFSTSSSLYEALTPQSSFGPTPGRSWWRTEARPHNNVGGVGVAVAILGVQPEI